MLYCDLDLVRFLSSSFSLANPKPIQIHFSMHLICFETAMNYVRSHTYAEHLNTSITTMTWWRQWHPLLLLGCVQFFSFCSACLFTRCQIEGMIFPMRENIPTANRFNSWFNCYVNVCDAMHTLNSKFTCLFISNAIWFHFDMIVCLSVCLCIWSALKPKWYK